MKHKILLIIITITFYSITSLGQNNIDHKSILGKWQLEIIRDGSETPIDITTTTENTMPEIFPFITFKKNRVILLHGKSKWKGKWQMQDNHLVLYIKNKPILTYPDISLTQSNLTLKNSFSLSDGESMEIKILYKKI